jgi:uncharacterized integral membrane protein
MARTPENTEPAKPPARRSQRPKLVAAAALGAVITVFALLNIDEVDVNWAFGTWSTPLILVVALAFAAGMAIDRVLVMRSRSKPSKRARPTDASASMTPGSGTAG